MSDLVYSREDLIRIVATLASAIKANDPVPMHELYAADAELAGWFERLFAACAPRPLQEAAPNE